jgi:small subunit ribosomal protein S11
MAKQTKKTPIKKIKNKASKGVAHIQATFNNTIVTITTLKGDVLAWASAGSCGFKGARKGTPFAAQKAAEAASKKSIDSGMKEVKILVKGPGRGRKTSIRKIKDIGLNFQLIRDITPLPHNGCRPRKKRRI